MSKVGLIFLLILVLQQVQAMALESEAPLPGGMNPLEPSDHQKKSDKIGGSILGPSISSSSQELEGESKAEAAESPDIRRMGKHHSTDKSVAGGGVIIGGLVTTTFAVVYCYIRVTRKRSDSGGDGAH